MGNVCGTEINMNTVSERISKKMKSLRKIRIAKTMNTITENERAVKFLLNQEIEQREKIWVDENTTFWFMLLRKPYEDFLRKDEDQDLVANLMQEEQEKRAEIISQEYHSFVGYLGYSYPLLWRDGPGLWDKALYFSIFLIHRRPIESFEHNWVKKKKDHDGCAVQ